MPDNPVQHGNNESVKVSQADFRMATHGWYFTKDEIDNHSPSRKDGIDRARESSLRKLYCSFLTDLGMKLRVSPMTTATAMMFCHRFYMRQSHAKNDWQTLATASMFLASKVEDNLRPLRDVAIVAYEIIYKWDPSASERIKQREVYYKQKELILVAENLLLVTIAFDMCVQHPFRPLVDALKRLKISNDDVAKAAWNLVNEWLRTTLCLQYKPHYVAAASLSVAAKLLKFKLPIIDGQAWWLQFDVSPKQLEEVTQQMLRYFKHDETPKAPHLPVKVTKPTLKVGHASIQSAQSSITVGSDPVEKVTILTGQDQKPCPIKNRQEGRTESCQLLLKATSEHEERHEIPQVPINVTKPTLKLKNDASQSGIMVGSEIDEGARVCMYGQKGKRGQIKVRGAFEHQSSDCCSGISGVVDFESVDTTSKMVRVDDEHSKVDVDRLKGKNQRTKRVKGSRNEVDGLVQTELDSEFLIESELEKGVEIEYEAAIKRQKL